MKVLLIALTMALSACGGDDGPSAPSTLPPPNYAGSWSGTYVISGCNQTGQVASVNICGALGNSSPYSFSLTQSSRNVSGSFQLGTVNFPNTGGTIAGDGSLALSGTTVSNSVTVVVNWALNLPGTALTGTVSQQWTSTGLTGAANVVGTISTANRTAGIAPSSLTSLRSPSDLASAIAGR